MCNICGKFMRDDLLKRHMNWKHYNVSSTHHHGEDLSDDLLLYDGAKLKFELQCDDEVYQKNIKIREQISILLENENIP